MITYFYRNHKAGFSIAKVSNTITCMIKEKEIYEVPSHRALPFSLLRNLMYVYRHRNKKGINHIVGDIHYCMLALIGCKSVLTIHDTTAYDNSRGLVKKFIIKYLWFVWPLKIASKIVCISSETKKSILRFTKRTDIQVIHNAISNEFKYVKKTFNIQEPNILIVGTAWNKNLLRTIQAIINIKCRLTIIGGLQPKISSFLGENHIKYDNKIDLTDDDLFEEYVKCDILCFCSLYEGFGMPIIEANATGRVVITSKIEPLIEIATDSALLINPLDVNKIREGLLHIINDKKLRERLISNGLKNIKRFQSITILKEYQSIYDNMV